MKKFAPKPVKNILSHLQHGDIDTEMNMLLEVDKDTISDNSNFKTARKNPKDNRYNNVLPNESTLISIPNSTRYINANFVDGKKFDISRNYIVTQGPLEHTILDFWVMVYEFKSPVIVMLTKLMEREQTKCHKYWPQNKNKLILADNNDAMDILNESETVSKEKSAITTRKIKLTRRNRENNEEMGTHEVSIVHFEGWPDFGVPDVGSFRCLKNEVEKVCKTIDPLTVHCSAGIGRTGTFCTIDIIMNQMQLKGEPLWDFDFDVYNTVKRLKEIRYGMVQTKEQYLYCYKVLAEDAINRGLKMIQ